MRITIRATALIFTLWAMLVATPAIAARNCTNEETQAADAALVAFSQTTNQAGQDEAVARHLPWGRPVPTSERPNEIPLNQEDYVASYDTNLRVPIWSAERIDVGRLTGGRIDCMRTDPRLEADQASGNPDYAEPVYDLGHLTPSADQVSSVTAVVNTFVISNMTPQTCPFNEGIWQILEGISRLWANPRQRTYVLNGVVFDWDNDGLPDPPGNAPRMRSNNGNARVAVPSHFYKIVAFRRTNGIIETISIMMPNDFAMLDGPAARTYLRRHITTIASIERATGLRLFPDAVDRPLEARRLWRFTGTMPRNLCRRPNRPAQFP